MKRVRYNNRHMEQTSTRVSPKDVFLHLLAIATLYASAIAFNTLLFQYINYWFPEMTRDAYYYQEAITNTIRFALSVLIIVFPVYFWTSRMLRKMYETEPERVNLAIRKWLSYFTLFLAAGIAIGWLVRVLNTFLNGDFTTAFLLKALAVLFTTGSIFYYYRAITKGEENKPAIRYYAYFVALVILAAVVSAFFVVGSPESRRITRQDQQRRNDLQNIQYQIGDYFRAKEKLPTKLTDLNDSFRGVVIPKDPATGKDYEYKLKDADTFELCAEFALPWSPNQYPGKNSADIAMPSMGGYGGYYGPSGETWQHETGRQCFERTIDKDYFQPVKPL